MKEVSFKRGPTVNWILVEFYILFFENKVSLEVGKRH